MQTKTDIIFIVPSTRPRMKEESMGTLILAKKACLEGFNVRIARYWNVDSDPKKDYDSFSTEFVDYILSYSPSIISFYCRCEEYHICIDLSRKLKQKSPSIYISFGGPQSELVAKETILRFPFVDFVCCSEGENTIIPFLKLLLRNDDGSLEPTSVDGLTYRDSNGQLHQNCFPAFLPDNYIRPYYYYDLIPSIVFTNTSRMQIDVGRGCPFSCTYCSTKTFWKRKFRLRNLQDIVDEMQYVNMHFGINTFDFMHDLFTVNKRRVLEFCNEISKRNLKVKWGCDSRIDTIDFELIDKMQEQGMYQVFFGIETGSKRMQEIINKRLNLQRCDEIVRYCISKGIEVTTSFIYGFPEENEEDLDATIKMAVKFQNYGCTVLTNLCHIMNGTELYAKYGDNLVLNGNTAFNSCITAFTNLYSVIESNKEIFANFCDYPSPLRDEMKFLDVFRYTLCYAKTHCQKEHDMLMLHDYASLNMYRDFCKANEEMFHTVVSPSDGDVTNIMHMLKHSTSSITYESMISNLMNYLACYK